MAADPKQAGGPSLAAEQYHWCSVGSSEPSDEIRKAAQGARERAERQNGIRLGRETIAPFTTRQGKPAVQFVWDVIDGG